VWWASPDLGAGIWRTDRFNRPLSLRQPPLRFGVMRPRDRNSSTTCFPTASIIDMYSAAIRSVSACLAAPEITAKPADCVFTAVGTSSKKSPGTSADNARRTTVIRADDAASRTAAWKRRAILCASAAELDREKS
jgi:hypothetical protein